LPKFNTDSNLLSQIEQLLIKVIYLKFLILLTKKLIDKKYFSVRLYLSFF